MLRSVVVRKGILDDQHPDQTVKRYTRTHNRERNKTHVGRNTGQGSQMRAAGIHNYNVLVPCVLVRLGRVALVA